MEDYDVIIIGAGVAGGLPAAAYLQKAGARVLVVDANQEAGCHIKTNEMWPGAMWTPYAGGAFMAGSPMMEDLELERYGVNVMVSPIAIGYTFPNHKNLFLSPVDPEGTFAQIARFSEKDAQTAMGILGRAQEKMLEFSELCWYSIVTPESQEKIIEMAAYIAGVDVEDFRAMNGYELMETLYETDEVRQTMLGVSGVRALGDLGEPTQGAFATVGFLMAGIKGTFPPKPIPKRRMKKYTPVISRAFIKTSMPVPIKLYETINKYLLVTKSPR